MSGRAHRSDLRQQSVLDFADSEDGLLGASLQTKSEYTQHPSQRPVLAAEGNWLSASSAMPSPVLSDLIVAPSSSIGVTLMSRMGWRRGQGVGRRVRLEDAPMHAAALPEGALDESRLITRAQSNYRLVLPAPKANLIGIGFIGDPNMSRGAAGGGGKGRYSVADLLSSQDYAYEDDDANEYGSSLASGYDRTEVARDDRDEAAVPFALAAYMAAPSSSTPCPTDGRPVLSGFTLGEFLIAQAPGLPTVIAPSGYVPAPALFLTTRKSDAKKSRWDAPPSSVFSLLGADAMAQIRRAQQTISDVPSTINPSQSEEPEEELSSAPSLAVRQALLTESGKARFQGLSEAFKSRFVGASASSLQSEALVGGLTSASAIAERIEAAPQPVPLAAAPSKPLGRTTVQWIPSSLLCKRFNVAPSATGPLAMKPAELRGRGEQLVDLHITPYLRAGAAEGSGNTSAPELSSEQEQVLLSDPLVCAAMSVSTRPEMSMLKSIFDSDDDSDSDDPGDEAQSTTQPPPLPAVDINVGKLSDPTTSRVEFRKPLRPPTASLTKKPVARKNAAALSFEVDD